MNSFSFYKCRCLASNICYLFSLKQKKFSSFWDNFFSSNVFDSISNRCALESVEEYQVGLTSLYTLHTKLTSFFASVAQSHICYNTLKSAAFGLQRSHLWLWCCVRIELATYYRVGQNVYTSKVLAVGQNCAKTHINFLSKALEEH